MSVHMQKFIDSATYSSGTSQYIVLPAKHRACEKRYVQLTKVSGSGTLDIHPVEFSVDGSTWSTVYSLDGAAAITADSEVTGITTRLIALEKALFPYIRLKIDVNTASIVLSVNICDID